jgi:dihydrofolate synthase / folylpolyglutamate synthase
VTAIALLAFAEAKVQLAILETGLGGRLDAITAVNADVKAITRIDLDHQAYLGETLEEIAAEKAAIIQGEFDHVVIGSQQARALEVILERCRELATVPNGDRYSPWRVEWVGPPSRVRVETTVNVFPDVTLGLQGRHQVENSETAVNVMQSLHYDYGLEFEDEDIVVGLRNARHPGRLEWIERYLLDGAHNIGGANALRAYLDEFVAKPVTIVFGVMRDKDVGEIASVLFSRANRLVLTTPDNSRAMRAEDLLQFVPDGFHRDHVFVTANAASAIEEARRVSGKRDAIVVTGSLYLVGEVRSMVTAEPPHKLKTKK